MIQKIILGETPGLATLAKSFWKYQKGKAIYRTGQCDAIMGTGLFGLADSVWPFRSETFRYKLFRSGPFWSGPFWSGPFRSGRFGLGTFPSRHFCTKTTNCICLFKWLLYRQAKCHASSCYTNSLLRNHDCDKNWIVIMSLKYLYLIVNADNDLICLLMITKIISSYWLTVGS